MALIRTSRFQDALRRFLNLQGPAPLDRILDEIVPTLPVSDPSSLELLNLRGDRLWQGAFGQTGVAANVPGVFFGLADPPSSSDGSPSNRWITTVEFIGVKCSLAGECIMTMSPFQPPAGAGQTNLVDSRTWAGGNVALAQTQQAGQNNGAFLGREMGRFDVPSPGTVFIPLRIVLTRSTSFAVWFNTAGVNTLRVFAYGHERLIEPGEFTP